MAFIRNKKKKTEDILKTEKQKAKEVKRKLKINKKQLKLCRRATFNVSFTRYFWFLVFSTDVAIIYFGYDRGFFKFKDDPSTSSITCFSIALLLLIISVCRIVSSYGFNKKLGSDRNSYWKSAPEEHSPFVRELYVLLGEKRCAHFWITFILIFMSILNFLYVVIVSGILKATGKDMKLWDKSTWENPNILEFFKTLDTKISSWDWSQFLTFFSVSAIIVLFIQYWLISGRNKKFMLAIEGMYGKEKMIDECIYIHRIHKIHKRYKSVAFVVLCILGVGFYFLFKKIICTIFDKSFSI